MRKEVVIAIVLGFGLGLLITFGVWQANKKFQQPSAQQAEPSPTLAVTPAPEQPSLPPQKSLLTITEPVDNMLVDVEEVVVSGSTTPEAIVVIFYEEGEMILEADQSGNFSTTIFLVIGANEVRIKAIDENGEQAEEMLTIDYSTAEI
ncbi:hypothetical protein MUP65_00340 [Patescibacteria group bacterium]|nr:hypothetical protein [Patescibacteria group bacterium]